MTPQTPERDFGPPPMTEPTLGEVFWPAYLAEMPALGIAHSELDSGTQRAVQAGAEAVAAHVTSPLRDLLDHETRLAWQSGLAGERARVAGVRERAGLEAL